MAYASGKHALGICDRCGWQCKYLDMKKEWTGMLVGFDEFEQKHPQLKPVRSFSDPQALKNPRPDRVEPIVTYVATPVLSEKTFTPIRAFTVIGQVTVVTA